MRKLLLIFFLFPLLSFGQGEANIWYFGNNAGLDFNSGAPVALTNGMLNTLEGCASISDASGNLLFYTDGMTVYDKSHTAMTNGTGLLGSNSSTQSAIIVKKPASATNYYIFTADGNSGNFGGLNYSEVDMSLNGGLGNVTATKNIATLATATCEKVCAIVHANGADFWIVTRLENSNTYHSYLFTATGLSSTPVITNIGAVINKTGGYMRASPDGSRIAAVYCWNSNPARIYDFDNVTGVLSNQLSLKSKSSYYGVEFSSDGNLLYISDYSAGIIQYNLLAGNATAIINSEVIIFNGPSTGGSLQLGPDGKIYTIAYSNTHVRVINNPNVLGVGCNFQDSAIFLAGKSGALGLPTFVGSYVINNNYILSFTADHFCLDDATEFTISSSCDSIFWDFGDGFTSKVLNPLHIYQNTGTYTVTAIGFFDGASDTNIQNITIRTPLVDLGNDTSLCSSDNMLLDATVATGTYLWQDGSTAATYTVNDIGTYKVEVTVDGCTAADSISVSYGGTATATISGGDSLCDGEHFNPIVVMVSGTAPFTLVWSDGVNDFVEYGTAFEITPTKTATYSLVSIEDGIGCEGVVAGVASYLIHPTPKVDFTISPPYAYLDSAFIEFTNQSSDHNESIWYFGVGGNLLNDMSSVLTYEYDRSGEYTVQLAVSSEFGCSATLNKTLRILPVQYFVPDVFTPNADGLNDIFSINSVKVNSLEMQIYDRWGALVYATKDVKHGWDGTKSNTAVQEGTYAYKIEFRDLEDKFHRLVGNVLLVR